MAFSGFSHLQQDRDRLEKAFRAPAVAILVYGLSSCLCPRPGLPLFSLAGDLDSGLPALSPPAGRAYFFGSQLVWFLFPVATAGAALDGTYSPGTVLAF